MITRNTKQKELIASYLQKNKASHLSIAKIKEDLKDEIGTTTIYRILNTLINEGKVNKINHGNEQGFCYEYVDKHNNCNNHYHLVCESCNNLIHYSNESISKMCEILKDDINFTVNTNRLTIYGICEICLRKENI